MGDKEMDKEISSLVDQLKDNTLVNKQIEKNSDQFNLSKEELEDFVIKNSGKLITQSLQVMDEVKDYIAGSSDPDSISALADLIKASSSAIEGLNKLVVQNKRSATTIEAKTIDVHAKYAIEEKKNENALIGTREEIFKKILAQAKVIDITEQDIKKDEDDGLSSNQ